ncbi:hypothetical protein AZH53_09590 [Methanomicrobiaceae archaeon CYW5]|uniref:hypothetical protein n=1 Tax=Methanovulcanius yangii TaxID=1789227 RepID=UPI0029C9C289|nr:hypothetical protein [Methanovulcanius yangii]MBT8508656.1 hypothetical protein [Methanovulcanius yangii]
MSENRNKFRSIQKESQTSSEEQVNAEKIVSGVRPSHRFTFIFRNLKETGFSKLNISPKEPDFAFFEKLDCNASLMGVNISFHAPKNTGLGTLPILTKIPEYDFFGMSGDALSMADVFLTFRPPEETGFSTVTICVQTPDVNFFAASEKTLCLDASSLFKEVGETGISELKVVSSRPLGIAYDYEKFGKLSNVNNSEEDSMEKSENEQTNEANHSGSVPKEPFLEFEELLGADGAFPRSYSDMLRGPLLVIVKEDSENSCKHVPVLFAVKYLTTVLSKERFDTTFRKSEFRFDVGSSWSGSTDQLDSFSEQSLSNYTLGKKIEFADLRKVPAEAEILFGTIQNRLAGASMQEFGFGIFATEEPEEVKGMIEECWANAGYSDVCRIITCNGVDEEHLRSRLTGYDATTTKTKTFHAMQNRRQDALSATNRLFDTFVKLGPGDQDEYQYPFKVACYAAALFECTDQFIFTDKNFEQLSRAETESLQNWMEKILEENSDESDLLFEKLLKIVDIKESKLAGEIFSVRTEKKLDKFEITPDISIFRNLKSEEEKLGDIIEFESLTHSVYPMKTIDGTLKKYLDIGSDSGLENSLLRLVVSPEAGLLFREQLLRHEKFWKNQLEKNIFKEIQFCTLNPPEPGLYRWTIEPIPEKNTKKKNGTDEAEAN